MKIFYSGREFGTASIEIHLKTCKQKWEITESQKPAKERRPIPEKPKSFDEVVIGGKGGGQVDIQKYNDEAYEEYNNKALMACPNCSRTFLPDRLEVHLRSCKIPKNKPSQQPELESQMNTNASSGSSSN